MPFKTFHPLFPSQESIIKTTPRKRKMLEIRAPANDTSSEKKNCLNNGFLMWRK